VERKAQLVFEPFKEARGFGFFCGGAVRITFGLLILFLETFCNWRVVFNL
jgi:hypothetical protein